MVGDGSSALAECLVGSSGVAVGLGVESSKAGRSLVGPGERLIGRSALREASANVPTTMARSSDATAQVWNHCPKTPPFASFSRDVRRHSGQFHRRV